MDAKFLLSDSNIAGLMRCIYPHVEMMPKRKLLLDGKIAQINHRHIVTAKNNLVSQRFWIVGNEAKDMLVFEVLHNRHAVGTEEEVKSRVFDETGLYGNDGYDLLDKLFILNQKAGKWTVSTFISSQEDLSYSG
jgi:hypothetical protein